jgi:hypothetical protein
MLFDTLPISFSDRHRFSVLAFELAEAERSSALR